MRQGEEDDSKLDPRCAVLGEKTPPLRHIDGLDHVITDPVAPDGVRPEVLGGKPIQVQAAALYGQHAPSQSASITWTAIGTALAKESPTVVE